MYNPDKSRPGTQRFRATRQALRGCTGAIDLASIMVGVLVIGIIGGVIAATVFAVIPWSQNESAKSALGSVGTAENVAFAHVKEETANGFLTSSELVAAKLIQPSTAVGAVTSANRDCYIALSRSATGSYFYSTNSGPDIAPYTIGSTHISNCDVTTTGSNGAVGGPGSINFQTVTDNLATSLTPEPAAGAGSGSSPRSNSSYGAAVLADRPVVYMPLNETSGPPKDVAGTVTSPIAQGLIQGAAGIGDGSTATSFNVPNKSEISLGHPSALDNMTGMTVEAVVKQDTIQWGVMVGRDNGGSDRSYQFTVTPAGKISLTLIQPNVDVCQSTSVLTPGVPAHVAATFDGSYIRVYFNGVQECAVASSDVLGAPANAVTWIGRMYDYQPDWYEYYRVRFTGTLAGVAIFDKALSADQILAHSNSRG